ncbi:hypothetical protein A3Q56_01007, partial [Intoshia linei]
MGADGGSIPGRQDLVPKRTVAEKKNIEACMASKWRYCRISGNILELPIVSCQLGKIYNKTTIYEELIKKRTNELHHLPIHIKSTKNIKQLNLTKNEMFNKEKIKFNKNIYDRFKACRFKCPITNIEMNGINGFFYLWTCGCVMSSKLLKEISDNVCFNCSTEYCNEDVITLNPCAVVEKKLLENIHNKKLKK